jgi:hypothetical protein
MNNFCAFILSHGRPDNVKTLKALEKHGYTGKVYIIIDNEDKTADEYYKNFPNQVIMFDKLAKSKTFDMMDNFGNRHSIVCARNACWDIAKDLGIDYFIQLDDDYTTFCYRLDEKFNYIGYAPIKNLDKIFEIFLNYYKSIDALTIAFAQGGDFMGGIWQDVPKFRKCMNSFFCSTEKPFNFIGTMNEDVNVYSLYGSRGKLFLTLFNISLQQATTQKSSGGMSTIYNQNGTFVKSFYTVMCNPSCTKISLLQSKHPRLHHKIIWSNTVPKIIREEYKK